jgi:Mrp family chromosome partitioning ATPase
MIAQLTCRGRRAYKHLPMLDAVVKRRLVFVTGKGGVGKTAVVLALAVAAARRRHRVLVVEVNPYGRVGEYLGDRVLSPEAVELLPNLSAAAIDPEAILEEFLVGLLRIRRLAHRLLESHTFRVVVAAAPGIEDFLTLVRIGRWEATRGGLRRRRFDLVIVDAPATGHSVPLLATPRSLLKMLPFGPLASSARELAMLLNDPERTAVLLVARAEEMAVNETLELAAALMPIGVTILPPVINAVPPLRFTREESRRLRAEPPDLPAPLLRYAPAGRFSLAQQRASDRQIRRLSLALGTRPIVLPQVPAGAFGLGAVEQLADELARSERAPARRAS